MDVENKNIIGDAKFTAREIDIISCLVCGRGIKKIALILSISPRTVQAHLRNIMQKLECNSQEAIIDRVEHLPEAKFLREKYSLLCFQSKFEKDLKEFSRLTKGLQRACYINNEDQIVFVQTLKKHLKLAGVKVLKPDCNKEELSTTQKFYIFSNAQSEKLASDEASLRKLQNLKNNFVLLVDENVLPDLSNEFQIPVIEINTKEKNYAYFFKILERLFPEENLSPTLNELKNKYNTNSNPSKLNAQQDLSANKSEFPLGRYKHIRQYKLPFLLTGFIGVTIVIILSTYLQLGDKNALNITKEDNQKIQGTTLGETTNETIMVRSDLPLPHSKILLNRPKIIAELSAKLKEPHEIQSLALVGMGGAGKTTLARQYAHQLSENSVIWEINVETQDTLKNSFEKLANALSKTEEDKKELKGILDLKDISTKENKILDFVKSRLKLTSNWFLIYDNVESFLDLNRYFPQDFKTWGKGKIILTSRNTNIVNNSRVSDVINIGVLDKQQKLELFTKIRRLVTPSPQTFKKNSELNAFIDYIPPYPLDISVAAYYLNSTGTPYKTYLENIQNYNDDFIKVQKNLLEEAGSYTKTRYSIIAVSLEHIIKNHTQFKNLAFFITLLDSNNIPTELLRKFRNEATVDSFIYNLKKYSLINHESLNLILGSTFSMHSSTQRMILAYLSTLNLSNDHHLIKEFAYVLDDYVDQILEEENFLKMRMIVPHVERFVKHRNLAEGTSNKHLESKLGCLYFYLNDNKSHQVLKSSLVSLSSITLKSKSHEEILRFIRSLTHIAAIYNEIRFHKEAIEILETIIKIYNTKGFENHTELVWALSHLGNAYRRTGNYEKAREYLEESLNLSQQYPVDRRRMALTLAYLGSVYRGLGFYQDATKILENSLTFYSKSYSNDHYRVGWILTQLGNVSRSLGNADNAEQYFDQTLQIYNKHLPKNHMSKGLLLAYLGNCYRELGKYAESIKCLLDSLKIHQIHFGETHLRMGWISFHLASTYELMGKRKEAETLFRKAFDIFLNHCNNNNIEGAKLLNKMAIILLKTNRLDESEKLLDKSLIILKNRNHTEIYRTLEILGEVYYMRSLQASTAEERKELKEKAIEQLNHSLKRIEKDFPKKSTHIQRISSRVNEIDLEIKKDHARKT